MQKQIASATTSGEKSPNTRNEPNELMEFEIEIVDHVNFNGSAQYSNSSTGSCCQCGPM